jgi:hypothetical protein
MADNQLAKRWHIHIEPGDETTKAVDVDFEEIADAQTIVEQGPDWTVPGYEITITYNDPLGVRARAREDDAIFASVLTKLISNAVPKPKA